MGSPPRRSRVSRILGAVILASVAVATLLTIHQIWMPRASRGDPVRIERLDLATAARFAHRKPGPGPLPPKANEERISLPPGSQLAWTLRMPEAAELRMGTVSIPAELEAELWVEEADEGGEEARVRRYPLDPCNACRIDLSLHEGRIARLGLRALPREDAAPGAIEIEGARLFGAPPTGPVETASASAPPSVVLYLIDTLRADKLGVYGNESGLTPELDAFAGEATVFEYAVAQAPWTKPSIASIFTGLYARLHGIVTMTSALPDAAVALAEVLRDGGYATLAVVTNGLVDAGFGFDQGFDEFVREHGAAPEVPGITGFRADKPAIDSDVANAAALVVLDGLEDAQPGAPFFLYVHVLDPHAPYFPPEPFKGRFAAEIDRFDLGSMESLRVMDEMAKHGEAPDARTRAQLETLYDAEIAHNDYQFGLFLDALRSRGLYDEALVIVVSDHGESFWEHGTRGHGKDLFEELLRVPLIMKAPHQSTPLRVTTVAQHVDLMPTLLDYAGIPRPEGLNGISLRPALEGVADLETESPRIVVSNGGPGTAIREGRWKVVKRSAPGKPIELYDLENDPGETRNVAPQHPIVARYLLETVARSEADAKPAAAPNERALTPAQQAELRALGYLE